jgi:4-hydroxy-tetrahydrodipicolinate synthase
MPGMDEAISGLWVTLPTPLDADSHVDHAPLVRHALWLLEQRCDGVVLFGSIGEGPSFTAAERLSATEALLKAGIPTGRIALGTGCTAIADTVALTRQAMALGLVHILILPPWYFRDVSQDGVADALAAIIDGVGSIRLRALLYDVPAMSGIAIDPPTLGRLRARYGSVVAGVHDCSRNFVAFREAAPDCAVLVGTEADIATAQAEGAAGAISAMANLVPALVRAMFAEPAAETAMQAATDAFEGHAFLPMLKAVLAATSGDAAWRAVRPPLRPAHPAQGARIAASLAALQAPRAA